MSSFDVAGAEVGAENMSNGSAAGGGAFASSSPDDGSSLSSESYDDASFDDSSLPSESEPSEEDASCRTVAIRTGGRRFCRGRLFIIPVEGSGFAATPRGDARLPRAGGTRSRSGVPYRRIGRLGGPGLQRQITVDLGPSSN